MSEGRSLYIDRNMIVNLWAAGHAKEILLAQPYQCAILEVPDAIPLLLWSSNGNEEEPMLREEVSILSLVQSGALEVNLLQPEMYVQTYVSFAKHISDKQAMLLTIVATQGALLATDDKCTRRVFHRFFPDTSLMSSLTLFRTWQEHDHIDDIDLRRIGRMVEQRAQFFPPEDDPLLPWWKNLIQ
jgi:hypothetical protein